LYNMACRDRRIASAIAEAVAAVDSGLNLLRLAGSRLVEAERAAGLTVAAEGVDDRTYQPGGALSPRTEPRAMDRDPEEAVRRVLRMVKERKVTAVDGTEISIRADTVCVHGDEPQALAFARRLREALQSEGVEIRRVGEWLGPS